jgi:lincosamide nucleotidyltransferase B/F
MHPALIQEEMIDRVRQLCHQDERISVALMYGSFTRGQADEYSDIEFYIFIRDSDYDAFKPVDWVRQISPLGIYFVNQIGFGVAIFENLIRGEFGFQKMSQLPILRTFKQIVNFDDMSSMVILDRTGELQEHLNFLTDPGPSRASRESIIFLYHNFLNSILSGINVLARGERARALDTLEFVQKFLLWLVRIQEDKLLYAETRAYKNIEKDIPGPVYARYIECTGSLHGHSLECAYGAAWLWSKELIDDLARKFEIDPPSTLIKSIDSHVNGILAAKMMAQQ